MHASFSIFRSTSSENLAPATSARNKQAPVRSAFVRSACRRLAHFSRAFRSFVLISLVPLKLEQEKKPSSKSAPDAFKSRKSILVNRIDEGRDGVNLPEIASPAAVGPAYRIAHDLPGVLMSVCGPVANGVPKTDNGTRNAKHTKVCQRLVQT